MCRPCGFLRIGNCLASHRLARLPCHPRRFQFPSVRHASRLLKFIAFELMLLSYHSARSPKRRVHFLEAAKSMYSPCLRCALTWHYLGRCCRPNTRCKYCNVGIVFVAWYVLYRKYSMHHVHSTKNAAFAVYCTLLYLIALSRFSIVLHFSQATWWSSFQFLL